MTLFLFFFSLAKLPRTAGSGKQVEEFSRTASQFHLKTLPPYLDIPSLLETIKGRQAMYRTIFLLQVLMYTMASNFAQNFEIQVSFEANGTKLVWNYGFQGTETRIYRKSPEAISWGTPVTVLGAGAPMTWMDTTAAAGVAYEYLVALNTGSASAPNIYRGTTVAGKNLPIVDYRGKLLLVIDNRFLPSLEPEISRFIGELTADGWQVITYKFTPNALGVDQYDDSGAANPHYASQVQDLKEIIVSYYTLYPAQLKSVILLGHLPVPFSGMTSGYAGHEPFVPPAHSGAFSTDVYYADVNSELWTDSQSLTTSAWLENRNIPGDGKFDQSEVPSNPEMIVGRIDFADLFVKDLLPYTTSSFQLEADLMRRYLNKNSNFRAKLRTYRDRVYHEVYYPYTLSYSALPYQQIATLLFGKDSNGNAKYDSQNGTVRKWFPTVVSQTENLQTLTYTLAATAGGGSFYEMYSFGANYHLANVDTKAPFTMFYSSYSGDFNNRSGNLSSDVVKGPVRVATTERLESLAGLQTIDGVSLNSGDRILVKDQRHTEAPTTGLSAVPGSAGVLTGKRRYAVSFITNDGKDTELGPATEVELSNQGHEVVLSNIPVGTGRVVGRRIFRTNGSEHDPSYYLLASFPSDNTTTSFADNVPDSSLGAGAHTFVKTESENGIYIAGPSNWTRAADADSAGELRRVRIRVSSGMRNRNQWFVAYRWDTVIGITGMPFFQGPGNVLRSILCNTETLTTFWGKARNDFAHPLALGDTIGRSFYVNQFRLGLYQNQLSASFFPLWPEQQTLPAWRGPDTHTVSLHGDPTLRLVKVAPPSRVSAINLGEGISVTWQASAEPGISGYHIYRSNNRYGPFAKITSSPVSSGGYFIPAGSGGSGSYFAVKAVKAITTPVSSYMDTSIGARNSLRFEECTVDGTTVHLDFVGPLERTVVLESSADGSTWSPKEIITLTSGHAVRAYTIGSIKEFFRIRTQFEEINEFSENIVGYYAVQVNGSNQLTLVANEFNALAAGGNNLNELFPASAFQSFILFKWNQQTKAWNTFAHDSLGNWTPEPGNVKLSPGESFFIENAGSTQTIWFAGEVPQGNLRISIEAGVSYLSALRPVARKVSEIFRNYPSAVGDRIEFFNSATQSYQSSFYDDWAGGWDPDLTIPYGHGFYFYSVSPTPKNWDEIVSLW